MQMQAMKVYRTALCQAHLNDHAAAVKTCLDAIESKIADWSPEPTWLLFELYREKGQVNDLVRLLGADHPRDDDAWQNTPAGMVYRWNKVHQLEKRGKLTDLIKICQEPRGGTPQSFAHPGRDIPCKIAAEALARAGDDAVEAIRPALNASENRNSSNWLLYALGRSNSPAAVRALQEIVGKEGAFDINVVVTAIWLQGESGKPLLEQLLEGKNARIATLARERLDVLETEGAYFTPWPQIPSDALPHAAASPGTICIIGITMIALLVLIARIVKRRASMPRG
jgi:hypothetical protein